MHPLAIMAVGLYGKVLPNQNGAPTAFDRAVEIRIQGHQSHRRIKFTERMPRTTWALAAPNEYGFFANVNPAVDHPRWSQASERHIGGSLFNSRRPTLPFNGYADRSGQSVQRNGSAEIFLTWPIRWVLKPLVFAACLLPALRLAAGAFGIGGISLGADPVAVMLHTCGKWTLNFLMITLCMTPLRDFTRSVYLAALQTHVRIVRVFLRAAALLGLSAARSSGQARRAVAGHRQAAVHHDRHAGFAAAHSSGRHLHRQGAAPPGPALDAIASPDLRGRLSSASGTFGGGSRRTSASRSSMYAGSRLLLGYRLWKQRRSLLAASALHGLQGPMEFEQ